MTVRVPSVEKHAKLKQVARSLPKLRFYEFGPKRLFDVFAVLITLPFVLPLIAILALMVRRQGGSAFYSQERVGRHGAIYTIWKLRTMVPDADLHLKAFLAENPAAAREWETTQKLKDDPRITSFGHILRKSSLDELPQLLNVLVGDMSLVGPRPMMPEQREMYPGRAYYTQRPGITGSWQVSERNESSFADRARFDNQYVSELSFANDVKILVATVSVVMKGTGY